MAGYFINPYSDDMVQALRDISTKLDRLSLTFPEIQKVSIPALERVPEESETNLIVGQAAMQYVFADKTGNVYPDELQPQLTPTTNNFYYRQLSRLDNLFQITGSFIATSIQQIPVATLNDYNTANGTNFRQETMEKLILPITNGNNMDVPLALSAEHEWRNIGSGDVIEWLEPFVATWQASSKDVTFKYQKGQYATPFGNSMEWDINVSFQGLVHLTSEEVAALAETPMG